MANEMTAQDRLDELTKAADRRKYEAKRNEAGFDLDSDYDTWKVLEGLRHLTIAERRAANDAAKPKTSGSFTLNTHGIAGFDYSLRDSLSRYSYLNTTI